MKFAGPVELEKLWGWGGVTRAVVDIGSSLLKGACPVDLKTSFAGRKTCLALG